MKNLILTFFTISFFGCTQQEEKVTLPNIIFILADDIGQTQLGCYGGPYQTPFLDNFASEGMRFTQAYASAAVCSPTRAALMTGKYPARLHLTDFIKGNSYPDSLLQQPNWQKFLPLEEFTIAEAFKELGYVTGAFGKWHLSQEKRPPESAPYNPDKQGFDEYMVTYKPIRKQTDPEADPHNVDSITNRAMQFLEQNSTQPFFLYVSHNAIHDPVMEAKKSIVKFEGDTALAALNIQPVLAAMVERLDKGVGKLLQKVNELGLAENTIVVFYGDNGGKETYASQFPFRKGKGWLYEGGVRVPLLIRWPQRVKANSSSDFMLSSIDFFPTLLEAVGDNSTKYTTDGKSLLPELLGEKRQIQNTQYWHYPHYHLGSGMKPASAIRKGKYKLIEWHEALLLGKEDAYELYDLEADIGEKVNLINQLPEVFKDLSNDLTKWKESVDAQMPTINTP